RLQHAAAFLSSPDRSRARAVPWDPRTICARRGLPPLAVLASRVAAKQLSIGLSGTFGLQLFRCPTEAPLALLVRCNRGPERSRVEIRPQQISEIEFGVCKLPEQEIGNALLSAGANEQVRLRRVRHRKVRLQRLWSESLRC